MKTKRFPTTVSLGLFVLILALLVVQTATWGQAMPAAVAASPVGTAFTYQGQLQSGGAPVDDTCDFSFSLWDAASSGNQIGSSQPALNVPVIGGLFAVELDFGDNAFTGWARWLQTAVRCPAGGGEYTTLAPRQALNPVPYAMQSQDLQLPFRKIIDSPDIAFSVVHSGNESAIAGYTDGSGNGIDGASGGSGTGVSARSDGTGIALGAWAYGTGRALHVDNMGTNDAASININNPDNTANLINAQTNGLGAGADIRIRNPLNTHSVLHITTDGSGWAGSFGNEGTGGGVNIDISNPLNAQPALQAKTDGSGDALHADAFGSGAAIEAWAHGTGRTIEAYNAGTNEVMRLSINNPDNTALVIYARTEGLGGGANFRIDNPLNNSPALQASTNGVDWAAYFINEGSGGGGVKIESLDPLNDGPALQASTVGSGTVASFVNDGSGDGVRIESAEGTSGLSVFGGSKNAVVPTSEGARLLYTEESSEVWFTDYGFGRLAGGSVFIAIDTLFAETVNLEEPYHVFVQAYGDAELYVSQRTPEGFEVRLRAGDPAGDPEVEFSYRLVATRRGYEGQRLEPAAWADDNPNLNRVQPAGPENGGAE